MKYYDEFIEERRTTPDSTEVPIWGKTREDRFFPWMSANWDAVISGWPISQCGPDLNPEDLATKTHRVEIHTYITKEQEIALEDIRVKLSEQLFKTLDKVINDHPL